jgi:hypothetical protein
VSAARLDGMTVMMMMFLLLLLLLLPPPPPPPLLSLQLQAYQNHYSYYDFVLFDNNDDYVVDVDASSSTHTPSSPVTHHLLQPSP